MRIRVIHNTSSKIPTMEKFFGDEFTVVFVCYDEYGYEHGVTHDSAVINFAERGTFDMVLEKTATVQGNRMTFTFSATDFEYAADYDYQVKISEGGLDYVIAYGRLNLKDIIE